MSEDRILAPDWKPSPYWWDEAPPQPANGELPARVDVAIVGGGYCGVTAALTLARHGVKAAVLEAGDPGSGASTRNHGHVFGVGKLPADLERRYGPKRALLIKQDAVRAAAFLRGLLREERLDVDYVQHGRFIAAHSPSAYDGLLRRLDGYRRDLGLTVNAVPARDQRGEIGSDFYFGGITIAEAGALQPAKLYREMLRLAVGAGALIRGEARVGAIERGAAGYRLMTARGPVEAERVVIATNAYTDGVSPYIRRRVIPVTAYMIATEELPPEIAAGVLPRNRTGGDTKRALYAFRRSPDGRRIVFAGRARFGDTDERAASAILHRFMSGVWPQLRPFRISHCWKGLVGFTFDFLPHMGEADGVHFAAGCQGAGVATMTWLGHQIALKLVGRQDRACGVDGLDFPTLPAYDGRPWFLPMVGGYYRWRDRLDRALAGRFD